MSDSSKIESSSSKKKREDKQKQKDVWSTANVLKLINLQPESQRLDLLVTKYSELHEEYKTCSQALSTFKKENAKLTKNAEFLQSEQSKLILARSRIEGLCRELQRQNKTIKEENLVKIREEEEKRKEVAAKFQATLNEVTNMVQENTEKNNKLRDDNLNMATKIKTLYNQFEQRKDHQTKMEKQINLERQLAQAQMEKVQLELKAEQELWAREREALEDKCRKSEETCAQLENTVKALHENLETYSGKYQEFKSSISKSNQVFDDCKSEMEKMSKQNVGLEKEVKLWQQRSHKNGQVVIELTANKQILDGKLEATEKKLEQMQKLCRQLQVDRSSYLKLLKSNGIEPISQSCSDDKIILANNSSNKVTTPPKVTKKEKHLEQLKHNLKTLQDQLGIIQLQNDINSDVQDVLSSDETQSSDSVDNSIGSTT